MFVCKMDCDILKYDSIVNTGGGGGSSEYVLRFITINEEKITNIAINICLNNYHSFSAIVKL